MRVVGVRELGPTVALGVLRWGGAGGAGKEGIWKGAGGEWARGQGGFVTGFHFDACRSQRKGQRKWINARERALQYSISRFPAKLRMGLRQHRAEYIAALRLFRTRALSRSLSRSLARRRGREEDGGGGCEEQPVASGGCRVATVVDPTPRSRSLSCARSLSLARSLSSLGVSPSLSLIPRLSVRETCARTSIRVAKGHFALLGGHQEEIVGVNGRGRQKDPSSLRTRKFPRTPPPPSPCSAPQGWC